MFALLFHGGSTLHRQARRRTPRRAHGDNDLRRAIWSFRRLFIKGASGRQRDHILGAVDRHSKEVITVRTTENIHALSLCRLMEVLAEKHPDISVTSSWTMLAELESLLTLNFQLFTNPDS